MGKILGEIKDGVFKAEHTEISGFSVSDCSVILGFRAEDASIAKKVGQILSLIHI